MTKSSPVLPVFSYCCKPFWRSRRLRWICSGAKPVTKATASKYFGKPRFVFFGLHQPAGIVFLKVDLVAVNIDGKGELGDVAVVNAPGFDAVAFRPFHEVFDVFAHAVGEGCDVGHGFRRPE